MRIDRLLSMILIISNKGRVTGKELAEHFEVSLRTVYRDIDKICEAGIPIASEGGMGGGFYVMENFSLDKQFLKKSEVQTLSAVMDNLDFLFGKNKQFNDIVLKFENSKEKDKDVKDRLNINMSHFNQNSIRVLLKFTARMGAQLNEYFHKDNIKAAEDDSYIVEDFFPYEEGLIKYLLGFGMECEVLEPEHLREEINNYIKEMSHKYNG
ncbi:MAG: helix-turn-helix transcriptional regulator [Clostridia bacterium]